jgi:hypothetical protein
MSTASRKFILLQRQARARRARRVAEELERIKAGRMRDREAVRTPYGQDWRATLARAQSETRR